MAFSPPPEHGDGRTEAFSLRLGLEPTQGLAHLSGPSPPNSSAPPLNRILSPRSS